MKLESYEAPGGPPISTHVSCEAYKRAVKHFGFSGRSMGQTPDDPKLRAHQAAMRRFEVFSEDGQNHLEEACKAFGGGEYEKARTCYEALTESDRRDPTGHRKLGELFVIQGQFEEAKKHFGEALKVYPNDVKSLMGLSGIARENGQYEEALQHVCQVLKIESDHKIAKNLKGYFQRQMEKA